jgi:hypothetical protein
MKIHQSEKLRALEAYNGAWKAHPAADVAHNGAVKAHNRAVEAHDGAVEGLLAIGCIFASL